MTKASDQQVGRGATSVFLSHSSKEAALAEALCKELEARGYPCWIAPRNVTPGAPYGEEIVAGIIKGDAFVLLASSDALASVQVLSEVEQAHKRGKSIYTILVPPAQVRGEMDFYLSRLHWLKSDKPEAHLIADSLAAVFADKRNWEEIAASPSLSRTMLHRPAAFARMVAASVVALLVVGSAGLFALNRSLDQDFRRLGYVDLSADKSADQKSITARARTWLMSDGAHFSDTSLHASIKGDNTAQHEVDVSGWSVPEQSSGMQEVPITLPLDARDLTTCLTVKRGTKIFRVTQEFRITPRNGEIQASQIRQEQVFAEDGTPCVWKK